MDEEGIAYSCDGFDEPGRGCGTSSDIWRNRRHKLSRRSRHFALPSRDRSGLRRADEPNVSWFSERSAAELWRSGGYHADSHQKFACTTENRNLQESW